MNDLMIDTQVATHKTTLPQRVRWSFWCRSNGRRHKEQQFFRVPVVLLQSGARTTSRKRRACHRNITDFRRGYGPNDWYNFRSLAQLAWASPPVHVRICNTSSLVVLFSFRARVICNHRRQLAPVRLDADIYNSNAGRHDALSRTSPSVRC